MIAMHLMTWTHGKVGVLIAGTLLVGFLGGGLFFAPTSQGDASATSGPSGPAAPGSDHSHAHDADDTAGEPSEGETVWTCSMDPQVRMSEPGTCPICGMDLIAVKAGVGPPRVEMTDEARRLAGIQTAKVVRKEVSIPLKLVGKVAFDETATARIAARFGGRIERMFVDYEGTQVRKGDHLYQIYSPELWVAQEELIQAERALAKLPAGTSEALRDSVSQMARAAREKLKLWELRNWQIRRIAKTRRKTKRVTIYAPIGGVVLNKSASEGAYVKEGQAVYTIADLSRVWVNLDVYESDIQWIRWGQRVRFEVAAYPGRTFEGKVAFVAPVMNPRTRTVQVRLTVSNNDGLLKPEMFVRARVEVAPHSQGALAKRLAGKFVSPMHPEVVSDEPGTCTVCGMDLVPAEEHWLVGPELRQSAAPKLPLVIPATAPLITGKRAVVFVEMAGQQAPTYLLREVVLGPRAGDWYVVADGVMEGEKVVVEGAFKLDSALQIRGDRSLMTLDTQDEKPPATGGASPADAVDPTAKDALRVASTAIQAARRAIGDDAEALQVAADELVAATQKDAKLHLLRGPARWLSRSKGSLEERQVALAELWTLGEQVPELKLPRVEDMQPPGPKRFLKALGSLAHSAARLSVALAADDLKASRAAASVLAKDAAKLTTRSKRPLDPTIAEASKAIGVATDLATLRRAYGLLSAALVPLVHIHYRDSELPVKLQRSYCPMAFKDEGAFWLEPSGDLANPYFGAQMLRCGTVGVTYE